MLSCLVCRDGPACAPAPPGAAGTRGGGPHAPGSLDAETVRLGTHHGMALVDLSSNGALDPASAVRRTCALVALQGERVRTAVVVLDSTQAARPLWPALGPVFPRLRRLVFVRAPEAEEQDHPVCLPPLLGSADTACAVPCAVDTLVLVMDGMASGLDACLAELARARRGLGCSVSCVRVFPEAGLPWGGTTRRRRCWASLVGPGQSRAWRHVSRAADLALVDLDVLPAPEPEAAGCWRSLVAAHSRGAHPHPRALADVRQLRLLRHQNARWTLGRALRVAPALELLVCAYAADSLPEDGGMWGPEAVCGPVLQRLELTRAVLCVAEARLPRLAHLRLAECDLAPGTLAVLVQGSPVLRELRVEGGFPGVGDGVPPGAALCSASLVDLSLTGPDAAAVLLGCHLPNLRSLVLCDTRLDAALMGQALAGMPGLRRLTLDRCHLEPDARLDSPTLRQLALRGMHALLGAPALPSLQTLELSFCVAPDLRALLAASPEVRRLRITACSQADEGPGAELPARLAPVWAALPRLQAVHVDAADLPGPLDLGWPHGDSLCTLSLLSRAIAGPRLVLSGEALPVLEELVVPAGGWSGLELVDLDLPRLRVLEARARGSAAGLDCVQSVALRLPLATRLDVRPWRRARQLRIEAPPLREPDKALVPQAEIVELDALPDPSPPAAPHRRRARPGTPGAAWASGSADLDSDPEEPGSPHGRKRARTTPVPPTATQPSWAEWARSKPPSPPPCTPRSAE